MGCGSVSTFSPIRNLKVSSIRARAAIENYDNYEEHNNANGYTLTAKLTEEVKLIDGTVSSPYPNSVTINQFSIPKPKVTFWQFINDHIHHVIASRGQHWDWLIEIATPRVRIKFSEIETKSRRLASALFKLGVRSETRVFFNTKNVSSVHLLFFAVWRMNGVVQIIDSTSSLLVYPNSGPCFVVCDRITELTILELMENNDIDLTLISIGKLRRSSSVEVSELLKDDGRECPDHIVHSQCEKDVVLITANGASHTNTSLIIGFSHLGILRHTGIHPRQYFYPLATGNEGLDHKQVLTTIFWPLAALFLGKQMVILDSSIIHSVTLVIKEFAITSICGCPAFLQKISRHIAEQGGSMPSVTSAVIHSTSSAAFSEKILRKGFPNLGVIDRIYGFEEVGFVSSTIPPPSLIEHTNIDFKGIPANNSGPLLHPFTTGVLGIFTIAKVIDLDTGVRLGPGECGEVCFKSGSAMKHYITNLDPKHKKMLVDGWIHSGDFGYYDASSGSLYITGRVEEVFKYYADYISPRELEFILQTHPDVRTCIVLGIPDDLAGHLPCGVIVRRVGSSVGSKEIRTFVNSRVSNSKQLRGGIMFLEELPETNELPVFRKHLLDYIQRHNQSLNT